MKKWTLLLFSLSILLPVFSFAQDEQTWDEDEEETEELCYDEKEPDELKEIFSAIQKDKHINKERIKRIKELIRDKGWLDKSKHS